MVGFLLCYVGLGVTEDEQCIEQECSTIYHSPDDLSDFVAFKDPPPPYSSPSGTLARHWEPPPYDEAAANSDTRL